MTAATLAASLLLGGVFLTVDRLHTTPADILAQPGDPIGDEKTRAQVIDAARQIVTVAQLNTSSAGYSLLSCTDRFAPPYRGTVYLTFTVPANVPVGRRLV